MIHERLRARLFRCIERAKLPFIKSQKSGNVWLGKICGIAFLNQQIFAFQERQFPVTIWILRDLQIVIPPIFFVENQKQPLVLSLYRCVSSPLPLPYILVESIPYCTGRYSRNFSYRHLDRYRKTAISYRFLYQSLPGCTGKTRKKSDTGR